MRVPGRRFAALFLVVSAPLAAEQVSIRILATTDLHGNLYPVDYYTDRPANRGLAKIATLVRAERSPNSLLIDCGDTIQGSPVEYVYQTFVRTGHWPLKLSADPLPADPMMLAMNHLGYDAMVLGNHEFNFGLKSLRQARDQARFPWLSANTTGWGQPYLVKTVGGVKVAVIGVTTPSVPNWEKPENYAGYSFRPAREAVESALQDLRRERPDLVIVAAHAGRKGYSDIAGENPVNDLVTIPGIDAIVFGHTHQELPQGVVNGVLLCQPKNWGMSLGELDFTLERADSGWRVVGKSSRTIPVTSATDPDPEILRLTRPYHEIAERFLSTPVAQAPEALDGRLGRVQDSALVDAIHEVQLHYAKADVSFAALFSPRVRVPQGAVSVRQIAALYLYENELYAMEGDGRMVKDALENAARFFLSCRDAQCDEGPLINPKVIGFNYEMAQGVEYEIDLTRPEGDRIQNLRWKGRPLDPAQKLRIAVNSYRAAGAAGYGMFRGATILWRSPEDIRQLMIDYFGRRGALPSKPDGNWRIVPEAARRVLEREASTDRTGANQ